MSHATPQDYLNQFNENAQKMFQPWTKLNQAFLKNAEMMTEFSLDTIRTYSEMGLDSMRQIAQIDSPESAKNFSSQQAEILNTISQKMLVDAQRMTELGSSMQDEIMQVMSDVYGQTNEQMQANMKKTADQATRTAQEYAAKMSKMADQASDAVNSAAQSAATNRTDKPSAATGSTSTSSTNTSSSHSDKTSAKKP